MFAILVVFVLAMVFRTIDFQFCFLTLIVHIVVVSEKFY